MDIMMVSMKITAMKQIITEIEVVQAITMHGIETTTTTVTIVELVTTATIKTGLLTTITQAKARVTTM